MLRFSPTRGAAALSLSSMVRGPIGVAATVQVGLVTSLTPGTTPTVSNTGSTAAAVLAFGIPTSKTVAAGTTTTGAEGTSASVSDSGTASASIFDFTIPRGASPTIGYTFSTTTTDADPGAGIVRFNNATPASITAIYFDNLDTDGNTVTEWLDTFDDSTDTTHKGYLTFTDVSAPTVKIGFNVTGASVVDGTGYRKVTVTHSFGTSLFTNARRLAVMFARTGNKGTDGAVAGPGTTVDGEVVLFNGTSGNSLKRASQTGLAKLTAGVLSAATASTDYIGATTGSEIQKASAGGLTPAVPGTDFYKPGGTDVALADGGTGASTAAAALANLTAAGQGRQTIYIPVGAMMSRTTNGPSTGSVETTTNKNMIKSWDFDTTTQEFVQFEIRFPKAWNFGTVTFQPQWSHAATTTNFGVVWGLAGVARSDSDAQDVAFGTAQTSTDAGGTTNTLYHGPESAAITIAGTPTAGDSVLFQLDRTVANGSDTMAIDARLQGISLFFTTNAATDA